MSVFADAGYGRGVLRAQNQMQKRRAETAKLFNEFKRNNPYATAAEFNQFIEGMVGPEEYYLRGSLPAGDLIDQMAADNQRKKERAERVENVDYAAKNIALRNSIQDMAGRSILTHDNEQLYDMAADLLSGGDESMYKQSREEGKRLIGNLDEMRQRQIDELVDEQIDRYVNMIQKTGGDVSYEDSFARLKDRFPSMNLKLSGMKDFQDRIKKETKTAYDHMIEDQNIQRATHRNQLRQQLFSDPILIKAMTPGSENASYVEARIKQSMGEYGFPVEKYPEIYEELFGELRSRRSIGMDSDYTALLNSTTGTALESIKAQHTVQENSLSRLKDALGAGGAVVGQLSGEYLIPPDIQQKLVQFASELDADEVVDGKSAFLRTLTPTEQGRLVPVGAFMSQAKEQADDMVIKPQTTEEYLSESQRDIDEYDKIEQTHVRSLNDQVTEAIDLFESSGGHKNPQYKSVLEQQLSLVLEDIKQRRAMIASDREATIVEIQKAGESTSDWLSGHTAFTPQQIQAQLLPLLDEKIRGLDEQFKLIENRIGKALGNATSSVASTQLDEQPPLEPLRSDTGAPIPPQMLTGRDRRDPAAMARYQAEMAAYERAMAKLNPTGTPRFNPRNPNSVRQGQ